MNEDLLPFDETEYVRATVDEMENEKEEDEWKP